MAIFGSKKEKAVEKKELVPAGEATVNVGTKSVQTMALLVKPRVTEKVSQLAEKNIYVFDVLDEATKAGVAVAVRKLYKVSPFKIAMVRVPAKSLAPRGKTRVRGTRGASKKAYVYLKKGDKIEL